MAPVLLGLPTVFHCEIITMPVPVSLVVVQPNHSRNQMVGKSGNCLPQPSVAQPLPPHFLKKNMFFTTFGSVPPPPNLTLYLPNTDLLSTPKKYKICSISCARLQDPCDGSTSCNSGVGVGMKAQICRPCALLCFVCDVCVGSS